MNKVHGHSPPPLDGHLVERVIAQVLVKVVYLLHVTVGVQNHFWLYVGLLVLFLVLVSHLPHLLQLYELCWGATRSFCHRSSGTGGFYIIGSCSCINLHSAHIAQLSLAAAVEFDAIACRFAWNKHSEAQVSTPWHHWFIQWQLPSGVVCRLEAGSQLIKEQMDFEDFVMFLVISETNYLKDINSFSFMVFAD